MLSSGRSKASEASKSSSWKARPSATWAKYEHVLSGSSVPGASSLAPASAAISKRLASRSMRATDTRSTSKAPRRTSRGCSDEPELALQRSDAQGSSSKTSMTS